MATSREAVEEAVGAFLSLVAVVATGLIIFSYTSAMIKEERLSVSEAFIVDDVWFVERVQPDGTLKKFINISIYNHGMTSVRITDVHVGLVFRPMDVLIEPGKRVWVTVNYTWTKGRIYTIRVGSARGNAYEGRWEA